MAFCASGPLLRPGASPARLCRRRRPRTRMCADEPRAGAPEIVQMVERTARGHRLYVTDMSENECDVFEDFRSQPSARDASLDGGGGDGGASLAAAEEPRGYLWESPPGRLFRSVMLPAGYPRTVSPEFLQYAFAVVGRNAFRKANYVLGTSTLLYALGLSAESSLSLSVALNWLLKDGLGLVSKVSASSTIAGQVDRDAKFWRMTGDFLMVLSVLVELLAPLRPSLFLIFGSISSLLREVADSMSGPSYRVFLQSLAIDENIGDVSSRSEIHVVVGTIAGLAVGALTTTFMSSAQFADLGIDRYAYQIAAFLAFSAGHLACTYVEVRTVALRTLNRKRLDLVTAHYVQTGGQVPSVALVNTLEPLLPSLSKPQIVLGAQLLDYVECGADVRRAVSHRDDGCMVALGKDGRVGVMLGEGVSVRDTLRAMLQACKLLELARRRGVGGAGAGEDAAARERAGMLAEESYAWAAAEFGAFEAGLCNEGWVQRLLLSTGDARFREGGVFATPDVLQRMSVQVRESQRRNEEED
jgi:Vitamin B6 photo-protection and homoeostasis